jgi:hypothetical protein
MSSPSYVSLPLTFCSRVLILCTQTFTAARINQELAKEGIPLPFGNKIWASNWPTGKSPLPGLIIHLIPSMIVIIAPPPDIAYPFILDLEGYPGQIFALLIVLVRARCPRFPACCCAFLHTFAAPPQRNTLEC